MAALAAITLVATGCSGGGTEGPAATDAGVRVAVARVAAAPLTETFEAGGTIQAQGTATVTARILAPIQEVRVVPGDRVRAGQVLIVLDARDLSAQARSMSAAARAAGQDATAAVSERQAADAALALARATHERISGLHAKRSATAQELDDATGALRAAEARAASAAARVDAAAAGTESARAAAEASAATESFARITAPFAGVVTEKLVEPGNMAAPGTPLLRLEDTRAFRLEVRVDQSRVARVAPGLAVPVTIDGPKGTVTLSGTVAEVSRAVDADARAFLVKIALPGSDLRSGTFGRALFSGESRPGLRVPEGALVRSGQITSVFVVERGVARLRLVSVDGTRVLAGLSDGETVIVRPPPSLRDGARVIAGTP